MRFIYGRKDLDELLDELKEGEPFAVLRGSDIFAAPALERYAEHVQANHGDPRVVAHAFGTAHAMRGWPERSEPTFPEPLPVPLAETAGLVSESLHGAHVTLPDGTPAVLIDPAVDPVAAAEAMSPKRGKKPA